MRWAGIDKRNPAVNIERRLTGKNNSMPRSLTSQTAYKLSAFIGTAIVLVVPFAGWTHITGLEPRAAQAFEQYILADLDKRSLNDQLESIEFALRQPASNPEVAVDYTPAQLGALTREAKLLRNQIQERANALETLNGEKGSIVAEIKLTVAVTIVILAIGLVFAIFGFVAWYFHIQILEDRRAVARD